MKIAVTKYLNPVPVNTVLASLNFLVIKRLLMEDRMTLELYYYLQIQVEMQSMGFKGQ